MKELLSVIRKIGQIENFQSVMSRYKNIVDQGRT